MRGVVFLVAGLATGCSFRAGSLATGDGSLDDAGTGSDVTNIDDDAPIDAPLCEQWTQAPSHFDPCAIPLPTGGLAFVAAQSPYTIDTTAGTVKTSANATVAVASMVVAQSGGPQALLLSADEVTSESGVVVNIVGNKPLIIASWDTISLSGTFDAGSHTALNRIGAGANPSGCDSNPPTSGMGVAGADDTGGGGSGGGGGGAFRGAGGAGGPGDTVASGQNAGGAGGQARAVPSDVRGGCSGASSGKAGPGATNGDPMRRAPGGAGGGALQLTARVSITTTSAQLLAGGGGGAGTLLGDANGGGGGGAGGYIGLEAPTVTLGSTTVAANGGGGGGSALFAGTGSAGQDGQASATAAMGGAASSCSNAGGVGAAGAMLGGTSAANTEVSCGGGGGGGGAGFYIVVSPGFTATGGVASPAVTLNP